jgi:alanine dehydrogenase
MIAQMKEGAVIVDVSVDQGGCVETCRPTTHSNPTFVVDGVSHYCVANIPGAVPRTSTFALCNATQPYVLEVAGRGWRKAAHASAAVASGVNVVDGKVTHAGVAEAWDLPYTPLGEVLG